MLDVRCASIPMRGDRWRTLAQFGNAQDDLRHLEVTTSTVDSLYVRKSETK